MNFRLDFAPWPTQRGGLEGEDGEEEALGIRSRLSQLLTRIYIYTLIMHVLRQGFL
jgi:hypothetical protein